MSRMKSGVKPHLITPKTNSTNMIRFCCDHFVQHFINNANKFADCKWYTLQLVAISFNIQASWCNKIVTRKVKVN